MTKSIFAFVFSVYIFQFVNAQSVDYVYDNTGNRTMRIVHQTGGNGGNNRVAGSRADSMQAKGMNSASDFSVSVAPNPSFGKISFSISGIKSGEEANLKIYDSLGELVFEKENVNSDTHQDISVQAKGVYFVVLRTKNEVKTNRVVVQ